MTDNTPHVRRQTMRRRLAVLAVLLGVWSMAIEARLVYLQVVERDRLEARANEQQTARIEVPPRRGEIVDRDGRTLAESLEWPVISVNPSAVVDPEATLRGICDALGDCTPARRAELLRKLRRKHRAHEYVHRTPTIEQVRRVEAKGLDAVWVAYESRRFYPNRELGAHILGFVGTDRAFGGVEQAYDRWIRGEPGIASVRKRAMGKPFTTHLEKAPTAGATIELTIRSSLQHVVERELRRGVEANRADGGSAIVMDPHTGEVLALANYPTFNLNAFNAVPARYHRNRAVQDLYEPGSTMKIVTAAAALEQGIVDARDVIDVTGGEIRFGTSVIRDVRNYGRLTFEDVIAKSSNVGAITVALKLGPERLIDYVRRFGFGRPTSPADFPGEQGGIVWPAEKLDDSSLARVAIGYQVAVTPLQVAAAMASIANGGELVQPRVVRAVTSGGVRRVVQRNVVGRTVTPDAAAQLTSILERVVEHGTAPQAQIPGYTVAGKTGTATKWDGGYVASEHNASFVGFVPSRAPAFAIMVVIDAPRGPNGYYGGAVAGPIFKRIAEAALRDAGVPPTINPPPPLLVHRDREGVYEQPASGPAERPAVARVPDPAETGLLPDLTGMSARETADLLLRLGLRARVHGTGLVVEQRPAAGTPIESGRAVTVWLDRRPPSLPPEEVVRQ